MRVRSAQPPLAADSLSGWKYFTESKYERYTQRLCPTPLQGLYHIHTCNENRLIGMTKSELTLMVQHPQ